MAKAILPAAYNRPQLDEPLEIDLKQPWLAALLAWLVPGLGHLYQGRVGKGVLFFVCVFGTFLFGFLIGDKKVVYASSPRDEPWRWQYYCQLGVGLPALPALVQRGRADMPPHPVLGTLMQPPSKQAQRITDASDNEAFQPNELAAWTVTTHPRYELGTVYTVIAGLLNILVICDAYAGPLVLGGKKEEKDDEASTGSVAGKGAGSAKAAVSR